MGAQLEPKHPFVQQSYLSQLPPFPFKLRVRPLSILKEITEDLKRELQKYQHLKTIVYKAIEMISWDTQRNKDQTTK
jgi:hypothetical protein